MSEKAERAQARAMENFKSGLNCAESVLEALIYVGALDAPREMVGASTGFGGGVGLRGELCGALSAAILANGLKHGRGDPYEVPAEVRGDEIAGKHYRRYNNLARDFHQLRGEVTCAGISSRFEDWHSRERRKDCLRLIGETAALACRYLETDREAGFAMKYGPNIAGIEP